MTVYVAILEKNGLVESMRAFASEETAKACLSDWRKYYNPAALEEDNPYGFWDGYADTGTIYELEVEE